MEVLDNIPIELDIEAVVKRMHLRKRNDNILNSIREMLDIACPVARPKAVYEVAYIENRDGDSLEIGGVKFISRVLRINLNDVERVFPYIVTCGRELEKIEIPSTDFIKGYYLDQIKETAVVLARQYVEDYLKKKYALGQLSRMSPGAAMKIDWSITQQKELFSVFGGREKVEELIGVRLTDSFLMVPIKSVSGILFPTEVNFESCQMCPRERCIGRRAAYDPELEKKYQLESA
jgi:hypothetical protein